MPQLIILDVSPASHPNQSSLLLKNAPKTSTVRFSKVILVNNLKTVYLMQHNQTPGTTRDSVNRRFIRPENPPQQVQA